MNEKRICPYCGIEFEVTHGNSKYCSPEHQVKYNNGPRRLAKMSVSHVKLKKIENNEAILAKFYGKGILFSIKELKVVNYDLSSYNDFAKKGFAEYFRVGEYVLITNLVLFKIGKRTDYTTLFPRAESMLQCIEYVRKLRYAV